MPNWVYHHVAISGPRHILDKFIEVAGKENLVNTPNDNDELKAFSYSNFISPPKNKMREYNETHGWGPKGNTGQSEWNWYNWNVANWGVKWDAGDSEIIDEGYQLHLHWQSPWGVPEPVLQAVIEKFPKLTFDGRSEEEQGWGCNWSGYQGEYSFSYWDVPASHADYANPDGYNQEESCRCTTWCDDDPEEWFGDCPGRAEAIEKQQQLEGAM
jgi:hypothetical protein